jgi:hypothetical protein
VLISSTFPLISFFLPTSSRSFSLIGRATAGENSESEKVKGYKSSLKWGADRITEKTFPLFLLRNGPTGNRTRLKFGYGTPYYSYLTYLLLFNFHRWF